MSPTLPIEAAIRQHQADQDAAQAVEFDPYDDDHVREVCGSLSDPVQGLLLLEREIRMTQASFGLDEERLAKAVIPLLKNLRAACVAKWEAS